MSPYVGLAAAWIVAFFGLVAVLHLRRAIRRTDLPVLLRQSFQRFGLSLERAAQAADEMGKGFADLAAALAPAFVRRLRWRREQEREEAK